MAVTLQLHITGLKETLSTVQGKQAGAKTVQGLALQRVAILLRDSMVKFAGAGHPANPEVQTGRLRSSIRYTPTSPTDRVKVGSDAEYAAYVEFGHSQTPGRFVPKLGKRLVANSVKPYPFVRPAITDVIDSGQALRLVKNTVKEALGI